MGINTSYKIVLRIKKIDDTSDLTRISDQVMVFFINYFLKIKVRFISNKKTNRKYEAENVVGFYGNSCRSSLLRHVVSRYSSLCSNGKCSMCVIFEIDYLDLIKTSAKSSHELFWRDG
jgi:hypothetical protein